MEENLKPMPNILGMSLYESLNLIDYSPEQITQILIFHENILDQFSIASIDCFCVKCNEKTTFNSKNTTDSFVSEIYLEKDKAEYYNRSTSEHVFDNESFYKVLREKEFFIRSFYCPRARKDKSHDLTIVFRISEDKVFKIGQFPARATVENSHLKKYIKLDNEIYKELNRATGLYSSGIGVGSFVYLRRIIEKYIVYPELEKLIQEKITTNEQVNASDFKGKVS